MSESLENKLAEAIESRDAVIVRQLMEDAEFVLLSVSDEDDDEDAANVLSADVDETEMLVAFTSEQAAGDFVQAMEDMYEEDDEIEGYVLDGGALLDYMPPEHGLLLNPESEESIVVDLEMVGLIRNAEV